MIFNIEKSRYKRVLKMSGPVFLETLLGTLFGMVDIAMLGRIADIAESTASIAAVGITNQLTLLTISVVQALNVGATAMVARYVGAKRDDEIEDVVKHVVLLTQIFLILPITIIALLKSESVMRFFGAQEDAIFHGVNYFRVCVVGMFFNSFNFCIYAVLRGAGDTTTPMNISLKANVLNVFGNAILIYGFLFFPALGVTGAGIATTLSQVFTTLVLLRRILKGQTKIKLTKGFKYSADIMHNLIQIGGPASLEQLAIRVGIFIFTRIVSSLGTQAFATHQICLNLLQLTQLPGHSLAITSSALTGQSLGEKDFVKAEEYGKACNRIGMALSLLITGVLLLFGMNILKLFTRDSAIIEKAGELLSIVAIIQPFQTSQMILSGVLRGAGDSMWPFIAMCSTVFIIRGLLSYILVIRMGYGLVGAYISMAIDQAIRWLIILGRHRSGKWKYVQIR